MFCPNCGVEDHADQSYCRSCGLKLDAVVQVVADQFPSKEFAAMRRRKELLEKAGLVAFSAAGLIGAMYVIFKVGYYKMMLFGPDFLFWASLIAFIGFLLVSVFCFNYSKLFMRFEKLNAALAPADASDIVVPTGKLIEDRPFEPVPSITDNTTDLLPKQANVDRRSQY